MKRIIFLLIPILTFVCCDTEDDKVEDNNHGFEVAAGDSLFILKYSGYHVGFTLSKDMLLANDPEFTLNGNTGILEIRVGDKFQLDMVQEETNINNLKEELSDDQFFSYKFFDVTESSMMYQPILPDGTSFYYHYVEQLHFDSVIYTIRTTPTGEFSLESIKNMKKTILSIKPV